MLEVVEMTEAVVAAAAMAGALATDDYEHGYNAHDPDDLAMITQADPSMPLIGMSSREGRRQLHKLLPTTRYYREEEAEKKGEGRDASRAARREARERQEASISELHLLRHV